MAFQSSPENRSEQPVNPAEIAEKTTQKDTLFALNELREELGVPGQVETVLENQSSSESAEAEQLLANIGAPEELAERGNDNLEAANMIQQIVMNSGALQRQSQDLETAESSINNILSDPRFKALGGDYMAS